MTMETMMITAVTVVVAVAVMTVGGGRRWLICG